MSRTALRKFRLQMTRVFEMRDKRRSHLHEQRLQLLVLRARNKRLVERVEHAFMIGDLVIDIRLVEDAAGDVFSLAMFASPPCLRLWLVGLSSGVTLSFFTRPVAALLTPL
jgi:hypothetical protein